MAQRILRPLEYGDLLDETFDLYKRNFLLFIGISALLQLPLFILIYGFASELAAFASVITLPVSFIVMAAITWAVSRKYLGRDATITESYKAVMKKAVVLILTMLLSYVVAFAGIFVIVGAVAARFYPLIIVGVILIIPGVMVGLSCMILSPVIVLESKWLVAALNRCWQLAKGNLTRIFVLAFLAGMIAAIVMYAFMIPLTILMGIGTFMGGGSASPFGGGIGIMFGLVMGVAQALVNPIQIIPLVLLYYDLRVRKEGFDLELLATAMGESVPAAAAPPPPAPTPAGQDHLPGGER